MARHLVLEGFDALYIAHLTPSFPYVFHLLFHLHIAQACITQ